MGNEWTPRWLEQDIEKTPIVIAGSIYILVGSVGVGDQADGVVRYGDFLIRPKDGKRFLVDLVEIRQRGLFGRLTDWIRRK